VDNNTRYLFVVAPLTAPAETETTSWTSRP
jgi:hypothetical protein